MYSAFIGTYSSCTAWWHQIQNAFDILQPGRWGTYGPQNLYRTQKKVINLADLHCVAVALIEDDRAAPLHCDCAAKNPSIC